MFVLITDIDVFQISPFSISRFEPNWLTFVAANVKPYALMADQFGIHFLFPHTEH